MLYAYALFIFCKKWRRNFGPSCGVIYLEGMGLYRVLENMWVHKNKAVDWVYLLCTLGTILCKLTAQLILKPQTIWAHVVCAKYRFIGSWHSYTKLVRRLLLFALRLLLVVLRSSFNSYSMQVLTHLLIYFIILGQLQFYWVYGLPS